MRAPSLMLLALPFAVVTAHGQGFGVCRSVVQRTSEIGCWILTDHPVGRMAQSDVYWHLDSYADSAAARQALSGEGAAKAHSVVVQSLGKSWLLTIDVKGWRPSHPGVHVADIGPLRVMPGKEYSATFMEAIMTPGMTSMVHRHSGPEAWYTVSGETCLETPNGTIVGRAGHPAIVPEGPPMFLTATGKQQRRAIVLILHDAARPPTTAETDWKPTGRCK
jgi:quercetin dioxygenase-like cupin family protein